MVAYNFQSQFAGAVERGDKSQTIRRTGKRRHAKPGDTLQLYTGMRTKQCRLLLNATCLSTQKIEITSGGGVYLDGEWLKPCYIYPLAIADGFKSEDDFFEFFIKKAAFEGVLIKWEPACSKCLRPPSLVGGAIYG